VRSKFSDELQDVLDKVPSQDVLVILGDLTARVGVLREGEKDWGGVLRRHVWGNVEDEASGYVRT